VGRLKQRETRAGSVRGAIPGYDQAYLRK